MFNTQPLKLDPGWVYWHEPATATNVVHIEDFAQHIVYTNIAAKGGSFMHLKGTLQLLN